MVWMDIFYQWVTLSLELRVFYCLHLLIDGHLLTIVYLFPFKQKSSQRAT